MKIKGKIRPDCWYYKNGNGCSILSPMICRQKKKCPFFKTEAQYREEQAKYQELGNAWRRAHANE